MLRSPWGMALPLSELADVTTTLGRASILHQDGRRRQVVSCSIAPGRSLSEFVEDAKQAVAEQVKLPRGVYVEFSGVDEARAAAETELMGRAAAAGIGIILLLGIALGSPRNTGLVLLNTPFALVGGVLAVVATGWLAGDMSLSLGSEVGFVTLFGVTLRNSILQMSHFEHLVLEENLPWNFATAIKGASERLIPIIMTALVTALGLLPLALKSGAAGCEIEGPMAIVILGGLVTSTVFNLLALPLLAARYARFERSEETALPA